MNCAFSALDTQRHYPGAVPRSSIDTALLVLIRLIALFFALSIAVPICAFAQRPRLSDDRELKEIELKGWDCLDKPGGTARTPDGVERNTLKNRSATDITNLKLPDWDVAAFLKNSSAFDSATIHKRRKDLGPNERQQLDPMEKDIVEVSGYLGVAYCGPPETTNCASVDFHDWHLEVFEKPIDHPPAIGDTTPVICEITPRTQNAIYADKVRIQELTAFFRKADLTYESTGHPARKIRVIGYRLWDDEHNGAADVGTAVKRINPNGYHNPWRQTAWEIHPAFKIIPLESPMPANPSAVQAPVAPTASVVAPAATAAPSSIPVPTAMAVTPRPSSTVPQVVTITQPVTIQIMYGQTTLRPGMKLPFVSRDAQTVTVIYMGERYPVPIDSTDLK